MVEGTRLSGEDWVAAGLRALVDRGIGAVKVLSLAAELGVTRGSFYWHFANRDALLERLLDAWDATNSGAIVGAAMSPGDIVDRYIALSRCWLGWERFDPHLDVAVRHWGRAAPALRERLRAADERRVTAIRAMLEPEGLDPSMTLHRARTLYYMQMGWFELEVDEPMAARVASIVPYFEIFIGRAPSPTERARISAALTE
ncbi:TetR/AcrR family transcriptional regulator [Candidatus Poriferisodalis sp.]|uniref:TetR/AcrR family transcriptional regulator n=1 Tax=Candidatus Poriferisodalis sp. TaxID=3101277 RepID=UPI003B02DED2